MNSAKMRQIELIDKAARGSIDAAAGLAEGYMRGSFGEPANRIKAMKWAKYAAKRGNIKAALIMKELL